MLVGGLALAVTIVVLALVLNSAIYTHNLASRSDSAASESLTLGEDTRRGVGGIVDSVNSERDSTDDFGALRTDYGAALESWESSTRNLTGSNGRAVSVTGASEREGVRIVDGDGSTFYPRSGPMSPWTVATEVRVRQFEMEVSAGSLVSETTGTVEGDLAGSGAFTVAFDEDGDGTPEWEVAIYEDADTGSDTDVSVTVHDVDASSHETCTAVRSDVVVDVTGAEVGTEECEPLGFLAESDGPYDVRFHNGGAVGGRYELTVDRVAGSDLTDETGPFTNAVDARNYQYHCGDDRSPARTYYPASSSDYPRVSPAIYSAEIETGFVGSDTTVRGRQRVALDEPGGEPRAPRVTKFDVSEGTSGDGEYTIDWAVEDPNGDLAEVRLSVAGSLAATVSLSGDSADPPATTVSGGSGSDDTIEIRVEDANTNTRTTTRTHDDDGSVGGCPA
jgi:hypothetical protein